MKAKNIVFNSHAGCFVKARVKLCPGIKKRVILGMVIRTDPLLLRLVEPIEASSGRRLIMITPQDGIHFKVDPEEDIKIYIRNTKECPTCGHSRDVYERDLEAER